MKIITLKNGKKVLAFCREEQDLEGIDEILKSVDFINDHAFSTNKYLTEIVIPDNIEYIGESVFAHCHNLTKVTLPKGLKRIEYNTFGSCDKLESVNIPDSVEKIAQFAFHGCTKLKDVELPAQCSIKQSAFRNSGVVNLTIYDMDEIEPGCFADCKHLKSVKIEKGQSIPMFSFINCSNLKQVELPNELFSIGERAFSMCSNLEQINLPRSLKYINEGAFSSCTRLTNIEMPIELEYVGKYAFNYSGISSIELPKNCVFHQDAFDERVDIKYLTSFGIINREGKRMLEGEIKKEDERFIKSMVTKAVLSSQMTHHEFLKSQALLSKIHKQRELQEMQDEQNLQEV